jgi:hypothetical protein
MNIKDKIYKEIDKSHRKIEKGGDFTYLSAYLDGLEFVLEILEKEIFKTIKRDKK